METRDGKTIVRIAEVAALMKCSPDTATERLKELQERFGRLKIMFRYHPNNKASTWVVDIVELFRAIELQLLEKTPKPTIEYVQAGTYARGEVPEYAFCESVAAGSCGHWHIRKVQDRLHLGGGIDTSSLCGRVNPIGSGRGATGGWDVNVKITEHHLGHSCPDCVGAYREVEH